MQLVPTGGQIWNRCKWRHLVDNFVTNASGAITWPTLQLTQVVSSGDQICKLQHLMTKLATNAIGVIWWSNLEPMQVAPSGGQLCD